MPSRAYLLSLPERVIRSALGLSAGLLREIGEVALPRSVRRGQLYKSLVDTTLRYLIEQVGGAQGVYPTELGHAQDFLARRGVGHGIELLGIAAFRVSPVWVFAALADLSGLGLRVIPEIAAALKERGLLDKEARSETVDQLLDSLEKTSARLAQTINAPPIDVPRLREEWAEIRLQARGLKPPELPSVKDISSRWEALKSEAARQERSIFEISAVMAIAAVRALPERALWLSSSTRVGAARTGKLFAALILEDYSRTLDELREVGYIAYARRQLSPYLRACAHQFSRQQRSMTERLIERIRRK
ncbi:MAG TPA: hypothetical protein VNX02_13480 [Steroidobacteraceae bacterium]|jgi:hypothetical protein|nr:hypothetical protein [Steroidobacteraceae bacterium]